MEEKVDIKKYKELKRFCFVLKERIKRNWDNVVAITGDEGVGKSTLAIWIGKLVDKYFNIERNEIVSTDPKELYEKITKLRKGSVLIVDEAIKILYKHEWASKTQKFLNTVYALARKENKTTLLCIPRFRDLNEFFRNHRVKFWIHVFARGKAIIFVRDWNPFAKDVWWMDYNQEIIEKWTKGKNPIVDIDLSRKIELFSKCKNFISLIEFPNLDKKTEEEYNEFVKKYSYEGIGLIKKEETKSKREEKLELGLKNLIIELLNKNYPKRKIAQLVGISSDTLKKWLVKWNISSKKDIQDFYYSRPVKISKVDLQKSKLFKLRALLNK